MVLGGVTAALEAGLATGVQAALDVAPPSAVPSGVGWLPNAPPSSSAVTVRGVVVALERCLRWRLDFLAGSSSSPVAPSASGSSSPCHSV
eukprot:4000940-Pyramimonas_sp.AAC.1